MGTDRLWNCWTMGKLAALAIAGYFLSAVAPAEAQVGRGEAEATGEIDLLKAQLAAQQDQIDQLRKTLADQAKLLECLLQTRASAPDAAAQGGAKPPAKLEQPADHATLMKETGMGSPTGRQQRSLQEVMAEEPETSPLSFGIGAVSITPIGFMDFTAVIRDRNVGSGIGTNFGSIPFSNTVSGHLREYRFSAQHSRLGMRADSKVGGARVIGYLETDFLGIVPGNVAVTSNSDTQRLRLFWVDLRKNKFEFLAGQAWSMLTPNRKGLSPLPADIFFTQAVDPNYLVGLTWSRNPQFRLAYHPSESIALGLSLEAAEQYAGGASGSGAITLPAALVSFYTPQLNTGGSSYSVPNPHQDIITKIAFDPKAGNRSMHFEFVGLLSRFAFYNPLTNRSFSASGEAARSISALKQRGICDCSSTHSMATAAGDGSSARDRT